MEMMYAANEESAKVVAENIFAFYKSVIEHDIRGEAATLYRA